MGQFEILPGGNYQYYYNLSEEYGKVILTSQRHATIQGCLSAIESVKKHSAYDCQFDRKIAMDRKYYFTLRSFSNEIIGVSKMYNSNGARDKDLEAVKRNAANSEIVWNNITDIGLI